MSETRSERRLSRARSARYRAAKRKQKQVVKAVKFKAELGAGTMADMECIRLAGDLATVEEGLTLAVRYMAGMARRDLQAFRDAMNPRNPV
ncbi:hypothetical protein [Pseudomonas anguilliseptica]|uniref:Uncharacterized protein n=1 Tax=Pseudomonas anguilliseptica TaxID=53406 RepID=A0A1H4ZZ26_PSEAG|nr:hypothetical protein [Pseudomonas anguilliseptica]SED35456.1 hypothetical protein SAMN05421553_2510 [Pseudomonas anguilliseptica]